MVSGAGRESEASIFSRVEIQTHRTPRHPFQPIDRSHQLVCTSRRPLISLVSLVVPVSALLQSPNCRITPRCRPPHQFRLLGQHPHLRITRCAGPSNFASPNARHIRRVGRTNACQTDRSLVPPVDRMGNRSGRLPFFLGRVCQPPLAGLHRC